MNPTAAVNVGREPVLAGSTRIRSTNRQKTLAGSPWTVNDPSSSPLPGMVKVVTADWSFVTFSSVPLVRTSGGEGDENPARLVEEEDPHEQNAHDHHCDLISTRSLPGGSGEERGASGTSRHGTFRILRRSAAGGAATTLVGGSGSVVAEPHSGQRADEPTESVPHAAQAMLRIGAMERWSANQGSGRADVLSALVSHS